jgi:hypothetical protein
MSCLCFTIMQPQMKRLEWEVKHPGLDNLCFSSFYIDMVNLGFLSAEWPKLLHSSIITNSIKLLHSSWNLQEIKMITVSSVHPFCLLHYSEQISHGIVLNQRLRKSTLLLDGRKSVDTFNPPQYSNYSGSYWT